MAYSRKVWDKWRAEIERNGKRSSRCFPTKRAAELWASEQELRLTSNEPDYPHTVKDTDLPRDSCAIHRVMGVFL